MKRLIFLNETFEAEKIVKTNDSVIGYNGQNEVFAFRGVSDFSLFKLAEGQEFDTSEISDKERIAQLEQENRLLKAQNNVLAERTDFHEEVLSEIILTITS